MYLSAGGAPSTPSAYDVLDTTYLSSMCSSLNTNHVFGPCPDPPTPSASKSAACGCSGGGNPIEREKKKEKFLLDHPKLVDPIPPAYAESQILLVTDDDGLTQKYVGLSAILASSLLDQSVGDYDLNKPKLDSLGHSLDVIASNVVTSLDVPLSTLSSKLDLLSDVVTALGTLGAQLSTVVANQVTLISRFDSTLSMLHEALYARLPYASFLDDDGVRKVATSNPTPLAQLLSKALFSASTYKTTLQPTIVPNNLLTEYVIAPYLSAFALKQDTEYPEVPLGEVLTYTDLTIIPAPYDSLTFQQDNAKPPLADPLGESMEPWYYIDSGAIAEGYEKWIETARYTAPVIPDLAAKKTAL